MELYLMGFAVAVPSAEPGLLFRARSKALDATASSMAQAQALVRTFDGPDAGLPQGQAATVVAPLYLDLAGRSRAGRQPIHDYLASQAAAAAAAVRAAVPGALLVVGWQQEGEATVQILLAAEGGRRRLQVPLGAWVAKAGGTLTGVLQGELLVGMALADPELLAPAFPHARRRLLEQCLPEGRTASQPPRL